MAGVPDREGAERRAVQAHPPSWGSGEDADATWADEESDDDQDQAVSHLLAQECDDAGNDEDDGEKPK